MLKVSRFGKTLVAVEQFATADTCSPNTYVVRVLELCEVGSKTILVEVIYFFLAGQCIVTSKCDNFYAGSHHEEGHVEANLVVAGTCRTVCDGVSADFLGVTCDGERLEDAFRRNRNGIAVVAKHIAINHIAKALVVILLRHVECHIFLRTELIRIFFISLELLSTETACVSTRSIYFITHFLCQIHHCIRRI